MNRKRFAAVALTVGLGLTGVLGASTPASAQCYDIGEEFGCFNPCAPIAAVISRVTGQDVYCTE